MKIGINASFARKPGSGIGEVTLNYLKTLAKSNKNFEFILYLEEDLFFDLPSNFTKRIFLPFYKRDDLIRKIIWEKLLLPAKIKNDNCEAFISLYQCPTILPKNIRHTMVVHDIIPELFPNYINNWRKKYYWYLTKQAIKKADKIIAVSQNTKDDLIKYLKIDADRIIVRHIDVDPIYKKEIAELDSQAVLEKYELTPGYIYSGGGLDGRKNIDTLIYAYKILLDKNKNVPDLVISGKLMPQLAPLIIDVEKIVEELNIKDKVKVLGFVPQENLPALYKNASLFVYPSVYEGFGLPLLEAMSVGTPVATSNASSLGEIVRDAGILFDPESAEDMAQKIMQILNDEELRKQNTVKAKEYAQNFSWEKFIEFE
ncbi:MAG: glycosyltransferase family 1 protein [Candidatus Moranbacteria bacterium]|jgi:glycosyltransferase involved in cell wall biosynthesis|nr:glycosyltransferase family 1 protein [Candidatus Moranbacteria bacterium]